MNELIQQASTFARSRHAAQKRKALDEPYWNHLRRVAVAAEQARLSDEAVAAAYLHDVVEDTETTFEELQALFPPRVVELVRLLTKWWDLDRAREELTPEAFIQLVTDVKLRFKPAYYARIMADPEALILKILDRTDNLRDMKRVVGTKRRWAERYVEKTVNEFAALTARCPAERVVAAYRHALADLLETLLGWNELPGC